MGAILKFVFWSCMAAGIYHYVGYPILLFILAQLSQARSDLSYLWHRRQRRCAFSEGRMPLVSMLIAAYNEETVIAAKAANTLQLDYPPDCLDIIFGLDAPSDSTAEQLAAMSPGRLKVINFAVRRGKLAVLRELAERTSADILIFTDANTMLDRDCIRRLVRHFADPRVGAVSGEEVRVVTEGTDAGAESWYWRYESALKILESRLNCTLGGNGAVLAVRRLLFHPVEHSIVEDFQIPLEIRFRGYRVIYDPEAIGVEEIAPTFSAQFTRRVRIGAGNYQTLFRHPEYLNPSKGMLAFSYFSHRVLRWCFPVLMIVSLACSLCLAGRPEFVTIAAMQLLFYAIAAGGYALKKLNHPPGLFAAPLYFCMMNIALLKGLLDYLRGYQTLTWKTTPRLGTNTLLHGKPTER